MIRGGKAVKEHKKDKIDIEIKLIKNDRDSHQNEELKAHKLT